MNLIKKLLDFVLCISFWAIFIYGTYWVFGGDFKRGFWLGISTFLYLSCIAFYIDFYYARGDK